MITTKKALSTVTGGVVLAAAALLPSSAQGQSSTPGQGGSPASSTEPVLLKATTHYPVDGAHVSPRDQQAILAALGKMDGVTWQSVVATGHADSKGPDAYNQKLSERRAQGVKELLVSKGVDGGMIDTAGRGESAPVASNDDARGRAQNRRTEIEFRGVRAAVARR